MCLIFFPLVFDVGNFLQGGLIFEYLVLPLIFVGLLLFELWERSACYLSCWGGGFSALFNICTGLVICCQSSLSFLVHVCDCCNIQVSDSVHVVERCLVWLASWCLCSILRLFLRYVSQHVSYGCDRRRWSYRD